MASGISQFCGNLLLNRILRAVAGTFPATLYIGLYTATPSDTGGGTEVTTGQITNYARQAITAGTGAFAAPTTASSANSAIIDFGTSSGGTGATVTQWGMFDAVTAGNLLFWADLTTPQTVASGNPYSFAIGALVIAMI
jgi:hypothetical protein